MVLTGKSGTQRCNICADVPMLLFLKLCCLYLVVAAVMAEHEPAQHSLHSLHRSTYPAHLYIHGCPAVTVHHAISSLTTVGFPMQAPRIDATSMSRRGYAQQAKR